MTVHLVKLCVGIESVDDLVSWYASEDCKKARKRKGLRSPDEHAHWTRMKPKRAEEVLDGGSIYWVVNGWIVGRQKLLELRPMKKNGVPHCGLVYDKKLVPVRWQQRRAFQGWRYLDPKDAPPDRDVGEVDDDLPLELRQELMALGLL